MLSWWSCQSPTAHRFSLLNHPNSFYRGMFKLNTKFDADSLLYLLSHFEHDILTVHMLTQWCLLPPLTSVVKSLLFTHVHSRPLSLAARLHQCHANCSCYIDNGWTFSGQTLDIHYNSYFSIEHPIFRKTWCWDSRLWWRRWKLHSPPPRMKPDLQLNYRGVNLNNQLKIS